ncbi:MAG: nitroreductase family protein [Bacteroidales bacterium]
MLKELILKNRSYRRFEEDHEVNREDLFDMIDSARLSASARNSQPIKYAISIERELNALIFPNLAWAGYLKDWPGPEPGERPSAYIIQLHDTRIEGNYLCDDGIAAQSILLTAVEKGLGGCIIASVKKESLSKVLGLPDYLKIIQVIALGKPAEKVVIEDVKDNDIKYWRDENGVHHVPKRSVEELVWK